MSFLLSAMLLATTVAGAVDGPQETIRRFYAAILDGDGYRAVCYLSDGALARLTEPLTNLAANPQAGVLTLAGVGVVATASELSSWDEVDLAAALIKSQTVHTIASVSSPTGVITNVGTQAYAEIESTLTGVVAQIPLVMQNGTWKLDAVDAIGISILLLAI